MNMGLFNWLMKERDRQTAKGFDDIKTEIKELRDRTAELKGKVDLLAIQKHKIVSKSQGLSQQEKLKLRQYFVHEIKRQIDEHIPIPEIRKEALKIVSRASFYRYLKQAQGIQ